MITVNFEVQLPIEYHEPDMWFWWRSSGLWHSILGLNYAYFSGYSAVSFINVDDTLYDGYLSSEYTAPLSRRQSSNLSHASISQTPTTYCLFYINKHTEQGLSMVLRVFHLVKMFQACT